MDWETVQDCLDNVSTYIQAERPLLANRGFRIRLQQDFGLEEIRPVSSGEHPLLQVADLFAGMAVFSRDKFRDYKAWLPTARGQYHLLAGDKDYTVAPSRITEQRFQVLQEFVSLCKKRKLGVSLQTQGGLWTPKPENPLNFWLYEAQRPLDKAPRRR